MIYDIIQVEKNTSYGTPKFSPVNRQAHNAVKLWDGQKSMSLRNIHALKQMGFVVKQVVVANGKAIEVGDV